ncbi:MAG TPA: 4-hydroxy-tetrahydrodipicolinate synthase [Myxococcales bacterium]|nr:4-hydroxy-tetrahydrodipicolinate synthase [Deltaproteobacteria bacterium]MBU51121.1 4-hydroxy-tetrahydrodipicolinate synthase [Deltaproteobacteria bacterium]HAA54647.1 4-hydroxy-tetrahydrodipicolinate synthase [Myxococcales bacterium]|tara:strand:- start:1468 stop:2364 length:897 start_codon:yes stop_codon:yes gene_type:complete
MALQLKGSMVALVTPFREDKSVDWDALTRLVDRQLAGGTSALIICGTTGEASTMTPQECKEVLSFVVKQVDGKVPVIAGTGSNNTAVAVQASLNAKEAGVDGLLVVTPPYNKPTQEGLLDYYNTIIKAVQLPVVLYNVPGRTCCNLLPETAAILAKDPLVVAIKDATADMNVASRIKELCGDQLTLLSGDDFTALPQLSVGSEGWISVTANIVPEDMAAMYDAWVAGDIEKARAIHFKTLPLHRMLFFRSNPIPSKAALALMGHCEDHVRSPLLALNDEDRAVVTEALKGYGLLEGAA